MDSAIVPLCVCLAMATIHSAHTYTPRVCACVMLAMSITSEITTPEWLNLKMDAPHKIVYFEDITERWYFRSLIICERITETIDFDHSVHNASVAPTTSTAQRWLGGRASNDGRCTRMAKTQSLSFSPGIAVCAWLPKQFLLWHGLQTVTFAFGWLFD